MKKTTLLQPKGWSTYFEIRADTAVHRCFTKCRKKHLGKFPVEHLWQGSMENTCKARSTTSVSPIFFRNFQNSYFNERPRMATSLWDIWILYLNCLKVKIVLLDLAFDCLIVVSLFWSIHGVKYPRIRVFPDPHIRESRKQPPEPPKLFYKKSYS